MKKIALLGYLKRYLFAYPAAYLTKGLLRVILSTCRVQIAGIETLIQSAAQGPTLLALWHNRLLILPEILHRYAPQHIYRAFISDSRDGDPLAILTDSYQCGRSLRVPHHIRHHALRKMIVQLKGTGEVVVITPDGPRGPRYRVKPGILFAAKETAATVILLSWSATRFWQCPSWDGLIVPKLFSTIHIQMCIAEETHLKAPLEISRVALESALKTLDTKVCNRCDLDPHHWPK